MDTFNEVEAVAVVDVVCVVVVFDSLQSFVDSVNNGADDVVGAAEAVDDNVLCATDVDACDELADVDDADDLRECGFLPCDECDTLSALFVALTIVTISSMSSRFSY